MADWADDLESAEEHRFGRARFGHILLDFHLVYRPEDLSAEVLNQPGATGGASQSDHEMWKRQFVKDSIATAEALEAEIGRAAPGVVVRATVSYGDVDSAGPGGIDGEIVRFLVSDDPVGRLADVLGVIAGISLAKEWLDAKTKRPARVSDGVAVLLAAEYLAESVDRRDVLVHYCTPVVDSLDGFVTVGYLVGLRADQKLYQVTVTAEGSVMGTTEVPLELQLPRDA